MKCRNITLLGFALAILVSCQNDDTLNDVSVNQSEPKAQYLSEDLPDGISHLVITEGNKESNAKKSLVEENCVTKDVSFDQSDSDFFLLDPNSSLLWPGNLLASRTIQEGAPVSIPIYGQSRNPVELRVNVLSGTSSSTYRKVEAPTPGKVQDNLNEILNKYYESNASFPASFEVSIERIHSEKQLQVALKAGYSGPSVNLSGKMGVDFNKQKTRFAVTLKQQFFTASVTPKENIIGQYGWLKEDVSPERLTNYVTDYKDVPVDQANPSSYIESVSYGRLYTMIYESDASALEVEAALKFAYKGIGSANASVSTRYKEIFESANVKVKQLGGNPESGISSSLSALANDLEGVVGFLAKGANVSRQNPGYPISYKVNYVFGNRTFNIIQNIAYTVKNCDLVEYEKIRIDPTNVSLHQGSDHGTSGAELFGRLYVEKYDAALGSWYKTAKKIKWGYGIEHTTKDYYPLYGGKREIASGEVIDFNVRSAIGERFRVVSEVGECDDKCFPNSDISNGGKRSIVYEYDASKKKWVDIDRHNSFVDESNRTVGPSLEKRTWNGALSAIEAGRVAVDYWIYLIK
ncbi:thiol-activated cytolysin family protein [Aquimarina aquimarini]|uniref:thiol-activated cytolysin family protein n=1 Tax=Aquimarina aquimarini TaxID=1191734 RepID=UPI000D5570B2|nr:thiol-activated cytolysin family protein [Aquimarina aquimarini]